MEKAGYPAKYAAPGTGTSSRTEARNFLKLEKANVNLFTFVSYKRTKYEFVKSSNKYFRQKK